MSISASDPSRHGRAGPARVLNFGSLNIDHVYRVDRLARPGETVASRSYSVFAGGKGANQSAALARAGAAVYHAGRVGGDGRWLVDKLADMGVDMRFTEVADGPTGHAIIQVDADAQNSIVLYAGANHQIRAEAVPAALEPFGCGDILLLQNEISRIPEIMAQGHDRGMRVVLNPAPWTPAVASYPLPLAHLLVLNETEAAGLCGDEGPPPVLLSRLRERYPACAVLLTLGASGAVYADARTEIRVPAHRAAAVDTTGAGDTFTGFFVAGLAAGLEARACMHRASSAAALCVSRPGAMDSIPLASELEETPPCA